MKQLLLVLAGLVLACPEARCAAGPVGIWVVSMYTPPSGGHAVDSDESPGSAFWAQVSVTARPREVRVRVWGRTSPWFSLAAQEAVSSHAFIAYAWIGDPTGGDVMAYTRAELAGGHASVDGRRATLSLEAEAHSVSSITPPLVALTRAQLSSNGSVLVQFLAFPLPGGGAFPLPIVSDMDGPNPAPLTIPPVIREALATDRRTSLYLEQNTRASGSCSLTGTWFPFSMAEVDAEIPDGGALGIAMFALCVPPLPPEPPEDH